MLNRWIGILSLAAMLLANAAVIMSDVVPHWIAGDAPPSDAELLAPDEARFVQVGIYDGRGRALGHSWTRSKRSSIGSIVTVATTTVLKPLPLPGSLSTPPVRIETEITFRHEENHVDELDFRMYGLSAEISLRGEAMPTGEFAGVWHVGREHGDFLLDSQLPATLGDVIRPFDRLPHLYVGQSWRMKLLDPLSQMLPQLKGAGLEPEPILVQVTGEETIEHHGRPAKAYVVEGGGATAWVAPDGRVLRQEVSVPLLGQLVLLDEPYDPQALEDARADYPNDW